MHARLVVVAGPSGSGKSRLCRRLEESCGLPTLRLDDFYKDGDDPTLPRLPSGLVDWDDPASWDCDAALAALEQLCRTGRAEVPVYDIARDGRVGVREVTTRGAAYVVAEELFAQEVVAGARERGVLADAVCVRHHRLVTMGRRLRRDLREHRKPPLVLVRRGWRLMLDEPRVVAHAVACGAVAMTPDRAFRRIACLPT